MEQTKSKKTMLTIIGVAILVIGLIGVTYAFFNYTRTGSANTIRVGRISFVTRQTNTINLTNLFPIDPTDSSAMNDNTKVGTLEIEIEGDTDYSDGVEYLISSVNSNITINNKVLPISLDVTVTTLGTESDSYFTARESKNATIYKKLVGETLEGNQQILVGYIKPNTTSGTAEGVDGSITIKAYLDKNKILISDTYNNGETPTDNLGTPASMGDGKNVFTTTEWNSLQTNGVSFQVKVEANQGIWVEEPPKSAYEIVTANVITPENPIDFANISSSSNGEGLYILPGTENDINPIYYYRGAVNNNNVIFGDFCWQMVRTTDTGGIKMIYNGLPDITGTGNNISYNCGIMRGLQDDIIRTQNFRFASGWYYGDDYEIVSTTGNSVTYRLKSKVNPITKVIINNASDASTNIPTIVANYPYTCMNTSDTATCTSLYKVDSYVSGTNVNVYASIDISTIGESAFNSNYNSASDVGYMSNGRYESNTSGWITNALFASSATWVTDHYELIDANVTTPDETHHYSCNSTSSNATCTNLRYVYSLNGTTKSYIILKNGESLDDVLYKMTGNGNSQTIQNNTNYVLNQNNSTVKTVVDTWFETNLTNVVDNTKTDYRLYLEDTVYCNERSYKMTGSSSTFNQSGWNPNGGDLSKSLQFGVKNRFLNNWYSTTNVPSTTCPNETDRFSVRSNVAHLNYPVGLLTIDEAIMAGASGTSSTPKNNTYYLYTESSFWSMSPLYFIYNGINPYSGVFKVNNFGASDDYVFFSHGVRPVVSLKPGTEFETGGDGTTTNPYVVKY